MSTYKMFLSKQISCYNNITMLKQQILMSSPLHKEKCIDKKSFKKKKDDIMIEHIRKWYFCCAFWV